MKTVLVITDGDIVVETARKLLPEGARVIPARKATEVRGAQTVETFDAIILSDDIPGEEGMEDVLGLLDPDERERTIVFWTEGLIEKYPRKIEDVFANAYGRRPADDPESLQSCLKRLLT